jgi:hypothetical protein
MTAFQSSISCSLDEKFILQSSSYFFILFELVAFDILLLEENFSMWIVTTYMTY